MDRSVIKEIMDIKGRNRYIPWLRAWVGFKQIGTEINRSARYDKLKELNTDLKEIAAKGESELVW